MTSYSRLPASLLSPSLPSASSLSAALLGAVAFIAAASTSHAALLPTEIYYNGPLPGADADEFLELTNSGSTDLDLAGYRFGSGLGLTFPDISLAPGETLVVAPNPEGFARRFAAYRGQLLDATGGLSNSGETLALVDGGGTAVFSLTYDDQGEWPESTDGTGDSLHLRAGTTVLNDPASWRAAPPSPGLWAGNGPSEEETGEEPPVRSVPVPSSLGLALAGFLMLCVGRRARGVVYLAPLHNIRQQSFQSSVSTSTIGGHDSLHARRSSWAFKKTQFHVRFLHRPAANLRSRSGAARL